MGRVQMEKNKFVPVNIPSISAQSRKNIRKAIDTGWISSSGSFVKEFEERFSRYIGVKYGIAVSSGTAALHVALLSCGIGKGDEVIVPAFTMAATWKAVLYVGAKPVFVDCDPETFCIDPKLIKENITKRTKAIIPVHIYGHSCDMDPVMRISKKHKLLIIEDAAEAHGVEYKGKRVGSFGDAACFSFYANKLITMGEGGMIVTNNPEIAEKARKFRDLHHSDKKRFIHDGIGFNYRLTNLQAAVGVGELGQINRYITKKQKMAELYSDLLRTVPGLITPVTKKYSTNIYWMYAILVERNKFGLTRDNLIEGLRIYGIETRSFFFPPNKQPVLRKVIKQAGKFPVTEDISRKGLYLPSGLALTNSEIREVVMKIRAVQKDGVRF